MEWNPTSPLSEELPRGAAVSASTSILDDDASFLELLFERPDLVSADIVVVGEARGPVDEGFGGRIAVAWRRSGGPVLLGLTTGSASDALLVETLALAGMTGSWPLARWNETVRRYWTAAPPELRDRVARRWRLPADRGWDVAAWTEAAWGEPPFEARAAVGVMATRIPEAVQEALAWIAEHEEAVAFRIRWYGEDATPNPRIERVVGAWSDVAGEPGAGDGVTSGGDETPGEPAPASLLEALAGPTPAPLPAEPAPLFPLRVDSAQTRSAAATASGAQASLLEAIETHALALGCRISRRGGEWIRFDGPGRSLRAFPGPGWIDLQLVGIDEGSLVGLRYRYGVPLSFDAPAGAPPGAHLRLEGPELDPRAAALLTAWLGCAPERPVPPAPPRRSRGNGPRKPRNPTRRRRPR